MAHPRLWLRHTTALVVGSVLALAPSAASATNWGSHDCVPFPAPNQGFCSNVSLGNNNSHQWSFSLPRADVYADFAYTVNAQYDDRTDLYVYESSWANADVQVQDANWGSIGVWGWVFCPAGSSTGGTHPNKWCRPQHLNFNLFYAYPFNSQSGRRYMACHEFGHTIGLRHDTESNSCMKPDVVSTTVLSTDDISVINAHY